MATTSPGQASALLALPAELVHHTLSYLSALDLASVALTCRRLHLQSSDDQIWQPIISANLPSPLQSPYPCKTFRGLYIAHHPHWFLPRHRLWFADTEPNGKLLLARYDQRRGCIEAYAVTAVRGQHEISFWEKDPEVIIHSFNPRVSLDLNQPVLALSVDSPRTDDTPNHFPSDRAYAPASRYSKETLMETFAEAGLYGSFMLTRALPAAAIGSRTSVWPPTRFPALARVRNDSQTGYSSAGHRPSRLEDVSEHNFRLRKWVEYTGRRSSPQSLAFTSPNGLAAALGFGGPYFASGMSSSAGGGMSIRMPEDITTYAALPESCYKPTEEKPWQGIWCGDYSGHGCEFLAIVQPDAPDAQPLPEGMNWLRQWFSGGGRRGSASSEGSYASAQEEVETPDLDPETAQRIVLERSRLVLERALQNQEFGYDVEVVEGMSQRAGESSSSAQQQQAVLNATDYALPPTGRLEAIKLTGDPNIPRGEYTFIAPDIGPGGFIRIADEGMFKGARVVKSAGHIAGRGFREDQYTPSQLIMISHDRLAQFWEGFGHISYFQRVDLEALMEMGV